MLCSECLCLVGKITVAGPGESISNTCRMTIYALQMTREGEQSKVALLNSITPVHYNVSLACLLLVYLQVQNAASDVMASTSEAMSHRHFDFSCS